MNPRRQVTEHLLRTYKSALIGFAGVFVVGVVIADIVAARVADPAPGIWMYVAIAFRYWVGIIAVIFISNNLRQFVAVGVTRRDFMAGATAVGVLASVAFAVFVPLGHGIEYAIHGGSGFSAATGFREFAATLVSCLASFVAGSAACAGIYRFGAWGGLALVIPALLPAAAATIFLTTDSDGQIAADHLSFPLALVVCLVATAAVAVLSHWELKDVTIRRSALG
ncbi:hypothetical protein GCM10010435_12340 [Winogradskya consettensis]|uniref:Uncharacterized protein n=1 Tax=Winogradskya consettensis TaxID=113560 RepID=A0A919SBS0_9ACTN|nr:twin-arginine translocation signal domain-containing protein [Actinoplanes consettensis]GIM68636.1 hypothetical protein Aco04nite_11600 [Actinoplanes consettensis]